MDVAVSIFVFELLNKIDNFLCVYVFCVCVYIVLEKELVENGRVHNDRAEKPSMKPVNYERW